MQTDIFAYDGNGDFLRASVYALDHLAPVFHVRRGRVYVELTANDIGKVTSFEHKRRFIEDRYCHVLYDAIGFYIAEHRNFTEDILLQRLVAAKNNDVRFYFPIPAVLDGVLLSAWICAVAARAGKEQE